MFAWDTEEIFRLAGGVDGILNICKATDPHIPPPQRSAVVMWKYRHMIAADWLPGIVFYLLTHEEAEITDIVHDGFPNETPIIVDERQEELPI